MTTPPASLPHALALPVSREVTTYTRFGRTFEPWEYSGWIDESLSWKDALYIGDWSPLGKIRVRGPDALRFFSDISVNSFARFDVGQAKHAIFCQDGGRIVGEGVLMRLAGDDLLFTSGPAVAWADYQFRRGRYDASLEMVGDRQFILQLQGPNSLFVLEQAAGEPLRDIGFMRFRSIRVAGRPMLALRQGMAGEVGFELHGAMEDALQVYEALWEAGQAFGVRALGGRTKMVNHVEACFPTPSVDYVPAIFGPQEAEFAKSCFTPNALRNYRTTDGSFEYADISELYRTPTELGWGRNVKFDHDFIGREALAAEAADPRASIATLVWNADDVAEVYASLYRKDVQPYRFMEMPRDLLGCVFADTVLAGDERVGLSTSRCYSYYFREMLSLAVLDLRCRTPGQEVVVVWGRPGEPQKHIRAVVAPAPYKRDNRRVDLASLAAAGR